jgi:hypothetical protein
MIVFRVSEVGELSLSPLDLYFSSAVSSVFLFCVSLLFFPFSFLFVFSPGVDVCKLPILWLSLAIASGLAAETQYTG